MPGSVAREARELARRRWAPTRRLRPAGGRRPGWFGNRLHLAAFALLLLACHTSSPQETDLPPEDSGPEPVTLTMLALAEVTARAAVGMVPEGEAFAMGASEIMQEDWFPTTAPSFNLAQSFGTGAYTQLDWQDWAAAAGMWTMTRPSCS